MPEFSVQHSASKVANLQNWKLLTPLLDSLQPGFDEDMVALILAGDTDVLEYVLEGLHSKLHVGGMAKKTYRGSRQKGGTVGVTSSSHQRQRRTITPEPSAKLRELMRAPREPPKRPYQDDLAVEISSRAHALYEARTNTLNELCVNAELVAQDLQDVGRQSASGAKSAVHVLAGAMCVAVGILPRVAVEYLVVDPQKLDRVLQAGLPSDVQLRPGSVVSALHNSFQPILDWLLLLEQERGTICDVMVQESSDVATFFLHTLTCAVASECAELSSSAARVVGTVATRITSAHPDDHGECVREWFTASGAVAMARAYALHGSAEALLVLLDGVGRVDMPGVLRLLQKKMSVERFLTFVHTLLAPLASDVPRRATFAATGAFAVLTDLASKAASPDCPARHRLAAIMFLGDVWRDFMDELHHRGGGSQLIVSVLKSACRDSAPDVAITAHAVLFSLLDTYVHHPSNAAPVLYKMVVTSLADNFHRRNVREFIEDNLNVLLERIPNMPVTMLIGPLLSSIETGPIISRLGLVELRLLTTLAGHERLKVAEAVLMARSLGGLCCTSTIFCRVAAVPLLIVIYRNAEQESMQAFVEEYYRTSLDYLVAKKVPAVTDGNHAEALARSLIPRKLDKEEWFLRKRVVSEILVQIVHLYHDDLNQLLRPIVAEYSQRFRKDTNVSALGLLLEVVQERLDSPVDPSYEAMSMPSPSYMALGMEPSGRLRGHARDIFSPICLNVTKNASSTCEDSEG